MSPESPRLPRSGSLLAGIGLMLCATMCFAAVDATGKYLGQHISLLSVVWARYAVALLVTGITVNPLTYPGVHRSRRPGLQLLRSLLLFGSTIFTFGALLYIRLDQAMPILFTGPLVVTLAAVPILGERVGIHHALALGLALIGVAIVLNPAGASFHPAMLLSVASMLCYSFYAVMTRLVARSDSSQTTLLYSNVAGVAVLTPLLPFFGEMPHTWFIAAVMVALGIFGNIGHMFFISAHRRAPASLLAPFTYTQLVWTPLLGFLLFSDVPTERTVLGSLLVCAAGLYLMRMEGRAR